MQKTEKRHIHWGRVCTTLLILCVVWNGIDVRIGGFHLWLNPLRNALG